MYLIKEGINQEELLKGRTKTYIAKVIGVSKVLLTDVMNRKRHTTKITAYCITKVLDNELEINDLFDRVGE